MSHFVESSELPEGAPEVFQYEANLDRHSDIHHDPWLIPNSSDLQTLAADIFDHLETNCPRPVRQRSDAKQRRMDIVGNLVASLALLIHQHPEGSRLAVSARKDGTTRYDRRAFSPRLFIQTVEEMESCGFITILRGTRGELRTTIEPTQSFRHRVSHLEVTIGRQEGAESIILKAKRKRNQPKVLIDYRDTPETIVMRAEMETVNTLLQVTDIKKGGSPSSSPVFMTRRFQIDHEDAPHTFDQHGRLYGGFWLSMDKAERYQLRVNGEEVVDLDFSAMHPRLAYLHAGLAMPNSDPYDIDGLPRGAAKVALSALLSRQGPMRRMPKELVELVADAEIGLDQPWSSETISSAMAERHPGIAHLFGTGLGMRLMKTESDILMETMLGLFSKGVPALPMHDGLMCPASHEETARREMAKASLKVVGMALPVRQKAILKPA